MDPLEKLSALFERFPGIGPRQAGRFVHFLLRSSPSFRNEFAEAVRALGGRVRQCPECMRYHAGESALCSLCASPSREKTLLAVVASDADLSALEGSGMYRGRYFVLGGTISLATEKMSAIRLPELLAKLGKETDVGEVILALPANPEGDFTAARVRDELLADARGGALRVTTLGRGLSTGSELEYADPETLKNAIENRK